MSTHILCFRAKVRKNVYPCTPQFYYIKVGCKGVFITRTCLNNGPTLRSYQSYKIYSASMKSYQYPNFDIMENV